MGIKKEMINQEKMKVDGKTEVNLGKKPQYLPKGVPYCS